MFKIFFLIQSGKNLLISQAFGHILQVIKHIFQDRTVKLYLLIHLLIQFSNHIWIKDKIKIFLCIIYSSSSLSSSPWCLTFHSSFHTWGKCSTSSHLRYHQLPVSVLSTKISQSDWMSSFWGRSKIWGWMSSFWGRSKICCRWVHNLQQKYVLYYYR